MDSWIPYDLSRSEKVSKFNPESNFIGQMVVVTRKQNLTWVNPSTEDTLNWKEGVKLIFEYYNNMKNYRADTKALKNKRIMFVDQIIDKINKVVLSYQVSQLIGGIPTGQNTELVYNDY